MGWDPKELNIDLNCCFSSQSFSDLLTEVSLMDDISMKLSALNDYVYFLEQEQRKLDAFKRELPLSMILLNDAIAKLKEELLQLKRRGVEKERVMPRIGNSREEYGAKVSDKKSWMSSAQLWSTPVLYENNFDAARVQDSVLLQARYTETDDGIMMRSPFKALNINNQRKGLAPNDERNSGAIKTEVAVDLAVDGLSLSMPAAETGSGLDKSLKGKIVASHDRGILEGSAAQHQSKKQRRCWSQELHQIFVNALLQLGGAQAATPKQIREIMQVDDLTNDEVKSHLQKYRLHIRKLQPSPSGALPNMEHWMKREERKHIAMPPSGSPEGPLHLGSSARGVSVTNGESVEEEEDTKSESQSTKGRFCKPSQQV